MNVFIDFGLKIAYDKIENLYVYVNTEIKCSRFIHNCIVNKDIRW